MLIKSFIFFYIGEVILLTERETETVEFRPIAQYNSSASGFKFSQFDSAPRLLMLLNC